MVGAVLALSGRVVALLLAFATWGCESGSQAPTPRDATPPRDVHLDAPHQLAPPRVTVSSPRGAAFEDVTDAAGMDLLHASLADYFVTGQAWGDVDGDGWVDLYLTSTRGPNALFRNRGDGTFAPSPLSPQVELADALSGGAVFVDFDNDGWQDLYVLNLGDNHLFRNVEGRAFVDVTARAGVSAFGAGESASFGDYDRDGFLDLYVANWFCFESLCEGAPASDYLFHNEGDGTFRDVSALLGVSHLDGAGFIGRWVDYDDDGDADLYLLNDKGTDGPAPEGGPTNRNVLWRNEGPGCGGWCFQEVAIEVGADARMDAMGIAAADYDADGDLDFFMSNTGPAVLLRNEGGRFVDVATELGVDYHADAVSWGASFLDVDHDGDLDLYLAVGTLGVEPPANPLFLGSPEGLFTPALEVEQGGVVTYTIGVNSADYDQDGDLDLIIGHRDWGYRLLRNRWGASSGHHWVALRLVGGGSVNRDAIGARVVVHSDDGRVQLRDIACGSSIGGNDERLAHFGLGRARPTQIEVIWPDGSTTAVDPSLHDRITVVVHHD